MALERTDSLDYEKPPFGKPETRYPTPQRTDLTVIEQVPIGPETYRVLPYGSPHPTYTNSGLVLVWQGPVKATNNQIKVVRIYAIRNAIQDWYNYALEYSGDVADAPIFVRTYEMLRTDYVVLPRLSAFTGVFELKVTAGGSGYDFENPPPVSFSGGGGSGAAANALISPEGVVMGLELTSEGTGYTSAPTISFGGPGSGATATAVIQPPTALLVKEQTAKLDSENPQIASLFIKVHRVYETLPGPYRFWELYDDPGRRGQVERKSRSIAATLDGGGNPISPSAATFVRSGSPGDPPPRTITKTWYEPRGESSIVLTQLIETWVEIHTDDDEVTSEYGGGILDATETRDEPGAQEVETGLLVVSSDQKTISPDEQVQITRKLSPESAVPVLELTDPGSGYSTAPAVSFSGGTCGTSPTAHAVLAFGIQSIAVSNGGSNYAYPPTVGFAGSVGGGALASAILGFALSQILVNNGGSGYTGPTVVITGDGTGATADAVLGYGVAEIDIVPDNNTYFEHYASAPMVILSGGGGSGALAIPIMGDFVFDNSNPAQPTVMIGSDGEGMIYDIKPNGAEVVDITVTNPGSNYTSAPTVSFSTGLAAATADLGSTGAIIGITLTNPGSGYTVPPTITFIGDAGVGATATAILEMTGSVKSITVYAPGQYETVPNVVFGGGGGGSGAVATASLFSTGSVYELILDTPGNCTVAPTVVFTGGHTTIATALYHLGTTDWPTLPGYWTDPTEGIVIDIFRKVVDPNTPHPGRGPIVTPCGGVVPNFVDLNPHDRWKSVQIVSKVDLNTLPLPELYPSTWSYHLPPTLLSIEAVWDDITAKQADGLATVAHVDVKSGTRGGILVKRSSGFHGYVPATIERIFFYGPPCPGAIPKPLVITPASGSVRINHFDPSTNESIYDDGGASVGDSNDVGVTVIDVNDHLVGNFPIINPTHMSPPQSAFAVSGGGSVAAAIAFGQQATMLVAIPYSTPRPEQIPPGTVVLDYVSVQKWRFGVWIMELVRVTIPTQPTL